MHAKPGLFILLGMSFSFTVVLALMVAMSQPSSPSRTRRIAARPPSTAGSTSSARAPRAASAPARVPEAPTVPVVPVSAQTAEPRSPSSAIGPISRDIQLLKKELERQLVSQEHDLREKLGDLARQLDPMPPDAAAGELRSLDDESVAHVLKKLPVPQRGEILAHMDSERVQRLNRRLRSR